MLQSIHETFARLYTSSLTTLVRGLAEVEFTGVEQVSYGEFVMSLSPPTCLAMFNMEPLKGGALLDINAHVLFLIIDRLLGGSGLIAVRHPRVHRGREGPRGARRDPRHGRPAPGVASRRLLRLPGGPHGDQSPVRAAHLAERGGRGRDVRRQDRRRERAADDRLSARPARADHAQAQQPPLVRRGSARAPRRRKRRASARACSASASRCGACSPRFRSPSGISWR